MNDENRTEESTSSVPTPPQPAYPQQPDAYPQQYQQPGTYPQQPAAYPQQYQQPGAYPQQQPGAYPQQQPGAYPQQGPAWGQAQQPGYPPQPQGWAQPGQPQTYWGPAGGVAEYGYRTSILAIIAGIVLVVFGLFVTLGGVIVIIGGAATSGGVLDAGNGQTIDLSDFSGAITVVGVVILIFGLLQVLSAIGIWAHKGWGRWLGIVFGLLGTLFGLLGLAGTRSAGTAAGSNSVGGVLVVLVPYAFVLIALIISGGHFSRRQVR